MLYYLCVTLLVVNCEVADGLGRRRIPVSVLLPEYIRMSPDPHNTEKEELIAKSKGVNVCVQRKEIPKVGYEQLCKIKHCERTNGVSLFSKQRKRVYFTKYDCCLGYERVKNQKGCPKDKFGSMDNIMQVAQKLGLTKFIYLAERSTLQHVFGRIGPVTIFIPSNGALQRFLDTEFGKKTLSNTSFLRKFLVMHVFGGRWPKELIKLRNKLENFLPGKYSEMNVKFYDNSMIIQNALVIKNDLPALNGIVHVIDGVFRQSYGNIQYILGHHKKLKIFNEGLKMINHRLNGFNTIFAPTDEAFKKMKITDASDLAQSFKCLKEFILTHVVHGLFFHTIMNKQGRIFLQNHVGDVLPVFKYQKKIYIRNLFVKIEYFAATDGSVYTIDRLLIPSKALSVEKMAKGINSLSLVEEMMTRTAFEQKYFPTNQNVTVFLPSNRAMRYMKSSALENLKKGDEAIEFLLNHMAIGKYHTRDFEEYSVLKSMTNHSIRITKKNTRRICVQGSRTSYRLRNIQVCNAMIHVITSHPIQYSNQSLLGILQSDARFSILTMALRIADLSDYVDKASPITFFAPSNEAWSLLDNRTLTKLFEDSGRLRYIIKYHMISRAIYSCNIGAGSIAPFALTGTRVRISFKHGHSHKIMYNYAETIKSDVTARNGVLYVVNNVVRYLYKRKYNG